MHEGLGVGKGSVLLLGKIKCFTRHEDRTLTLILIPKGGYLGISKTEANCRILGTRPLDLEEKKDFR
jgi:hypothetical protein